MPPTFTYDANQIPGVTAPMPRGAPVAYLTAFQLLAAGAASNPQTAPIDVPEWATYAVAYCKYTQAVGGTGAGSASGALYMGSSSTSALSPVDVGDGNGPRTVVMGNVTVPIAEACGGARIGFALTEVGDVAHPGIVDIEIVFH